MIALTANWVHVGLYCRLPLSEVIISHTVVLILLALLLLNLSQTYTHTYRYEVICLSFHASWKHWTFWILVVKSVLMYLAQSRSSPPFVSNLPKLLTHLASSLYCNVSVNLLSSYSVHLLKVKLLIIIIRQFDRSLFHCLAQNTYSDTSLYDNWLCCGVCLCMMLLLWCTLVYDAIVFFNFTLTPQKWPLSICFIMFFNALIVFHSLFITHDAFFQ